MKLYNIYEIFDSTHLIEESIIEYEYVFQVVRVLGSGNFKMFTNHRWSKKQVLRRRAAAKRVPWHWQILHLSGNSSG